MPQLNYRSFLPFLALCLIFILIYPRKILLINSDLGRYLKSGELLSQEYWRGGDLFSHPLLHSNWFSYTQPNFAIVNHHWLFGVFTHWAWRIGSFELLSILNTTLCLVALLIVAHLTKRMLDQAVTAESQPLSNAAQWWIITAATFLFLPLITHRTEVRPETVSLVLFALFLWLGSRVETLCSQSKRVPRRFLKLGLLTVILLSLQVIWANTHIFFGLGPLVAGYYALRAVMRKISATQSENSNRYGTQILLWGGICGALILVSAITPHGLQTLSTPLTLFENYGYPVAENQSTWFMFRYNHGRAYYGYVALLSILTLTMTSSGFWVFRQNKRLKHILLQTTLLFIPWLILANSVNRMSPFFALVGIQQLSVVVALFWQKQQKTLKSLLQHPLTITLSAVSSFAFVVLFLQTGVLANSPQQAGNGLLGGLEGSAHYLRENPPSGALFNNYDLGGYLIYYLYSDHTVFVDNRPEAYPASFLQETYIAAQKDEAVWQELEKEYNFSTIAFYQLDMTDWAQPFLRRRLADPTWKVVFSDGVVVILDKFVPEQDVQ